MTKEQAIQIIEQAINVGNLKGAYTLQDVDIILKAIEVLKS